jgi:hypothetical protein
VSNLGVHLETVNGVPQVFGSIPFSLLAAQGLTLARQALYHLSYSASTFL